jgi:hypothetical protein
MTSVDRMTLSVREVRMITERLLLVAGLPDGLVPAVRDCVLYSQAMGLGGLAALERDFDLLKEARPAALTSVSMASGLCEVDARGQHAWIAAPAVLDLALASARRGGRGDIVVRRVKAADELNVIAGLAGRYGAAVEVDLHNNESAGDTRVRIRVTADKLAGPDRVLEQALLTGMPVARALWERLYGWSHDALTPDSIESRRHAGPVRVDAQGRVHGRDDDDTDFSLLSVTPAPANASPETA